MQFAKKIIVSLLVLTLAVGAVWAEGTKTTVAAKRVTIKVLADAVPHAELLEFVKADLAAKGIDLAITVADFARDGNEAVDTGEYDANFFQHVQYLNSVKKEKGFKLDNAGNIHVEPIGLYAPKYKTKDKLPANATISIPNNGTNEYRALKLLEREGYITLKKTATAGEATLVDVEKYLKPIKIVELDAGQLVRTLQDFDASIINTNRVLEAGIDGNTALFRESNDSPYANIITTKTSRINEPAIQELVKALRSDKVKKFIADKYKGAVIPAK